MIDNIPYRYVRDDDGKYTWVRTYSTDIIVDKKDIVY